MSQEPRPLSDEEICAAVDAELNTARILRDGKIGTERSLAYSYYFGLPFGNEETGRSQIVSQLVMEIIDSLMPDLMKVFTAGEKVVEFVARQAEDVDKAEQATEVCNYVFYTQNDGFRLLYEAIKDALLLKTGIFKYWWSVEKKIIQETFSGLTEGQILILSQDPAVEIVAATPRPDLMLQQPPMGGAAPQPAAGGPPGATPGPNPGMAPGGAEPQAGAMPAPMSCYDVTVKRTKTAGHICIETVPPEELLVSSRARNVDVQNLPFVAHETKKTLSDLVEMGVCDVAKALDLASGEASTQIHNDLAQERQSRTEGMTIETEGSAYDPMLRTVTYIEAYQYLDADGDGISELRKICKVQQDILVNEPTERIPFACITPKIMPHEFYGVSLADDSADLQLLKSTLWRMQLDGLYLSLYPRQQVVESMVSANTYADLMAPGPGRPVRVKGAGAVTPMDVPYTGDAAMNMLEFIEQEIEGRTPVSRQYQGLQGNEINKTATSAQIVSTRSQARTELIARTFAETGLKDLFMGILWLLGKYQQEPMIVRINNTYQPIDPRAWTTEYDMTCNVGLGNGNKVEQLQILGQIEQAQAMAAQSGMMGVLVDPKRIYNLQAKKAVLAGYKDPNLFWMAPPDQYQPPAPQPSPQEKVAQINAQTDQQRLQAESQAKSMELQQKAQADQARLAMEQQVQQSNDQRDATRTALEFQQKKELAILELQMQDQQHQREMDKEIQIANIRAAAQLEAARVSSAQSDGAQLVQQEEKAAGYQMQELLQTLVKTLSAPKQIIRDQNGRAVGVAPAPNTVQ